MSSVELLPSYGTSVFYLYEVWFKEHFSVAVHDASAVVDNVADSGEESEDEWNYYKGDTANKENARPTDTDAEVS